MSKSCTCELVPGSPDIFLGVIGNIHDAMNDKGNSNTLMVLTNINKAIKILEYHVDQNK